MARARSEISASSRRTWASRSRAGRAVADWRNERGVGRPGSAWSAALSMVAVSRGRLRHGAPWQRGGRPAGLKRVPSARGPVRRLELSGLSSQYQPPKCRSTGGQSRVQPGDGGSGSVCRRGGLARRRRAASAAGSTRTGPSSPARWRGEWPPGSAGTGLGRHAKRSRTRGRSGCGATAGGLRPGPGCARAAMRCRAPPGDPLLSPRRSCADGRGRVRWSAG